MASTFACATTCRTTSDKSGRLLLAIALAYVSLGAILGFVQGGVGPILRAHGAPLASLRWVYALYLPFGIAFLWAPLVDAWRWPWLGPRTGWMITMQLVAIPAVIATAFLTPQATAWTSLLLLGLLATIACASVDVALDALTVEMIPWHRRMLAAAAKMGGIACGSVLGGGVLVAAYPTLGWYWTVLVIAGVMLASSLPMFALIRAERDLPPRPASAPAPGMHSRIASALRRPAMKTRLFRLSLLAAGLMALFSFSRLLLVDMGVSLVSIGSLLGTVSPIATALACLLTATFAPRFAIRHTATAAAACCVLGAATIWIGFALGSPLVTMTGSVVTTACAAALYVILGSLMLGWASHEQAATDYALLFGLGRFLGTLALMLLPGVIQATGWHIFQGAVIAGFMLAFWYFLRLVRRPAL